MQKASSQYWHIVEEASIAEDRRREDETNGNNFTNEENGVWSGNVTTTEIMLWFLYYYIHRFR